MSKMRSMVDDFLAQGSIAIAGVSRTQKDAAANIIYRKLREAGYKVFPLNPHAEVVEDDPCYPNLQAIPEGVDAVVIATRPETTEEIVLQCADVGVSQVWIHRSFGQGSISETAVNFCREHDIAVIPGGCPMMFCEPVDFGHRCMRWFLGITGGLPN